MKARSQNEVVLYMQEHPCGQCGTPPRLEELRLQPTALAGGLVMREYTGSCRRCGHALDYRFEGPVSWPDISPFAYGGDEPSQIIPQARFLALAEEADGEVPDDPSSLEPDAFFAAGYRLAEAIALYDEAAKFPGADRGQIGGRITALRERQKRYAAVRDRMSARRAASASTPAAAALTGERVVAHERWLKAGKLGAGRLELEDASLSDMRLGSSKLSGARLVRCRMDRSYFDHARFEGTELIECTGDHAVFHFAHCAGARLTECRFTKCNFRLGELQDMEITGGSLAGSVSDRASWNRLRAVKVDFRGHVFADAILDGAYFEDCDLRDADLARVATNLRALGSSLNTTFVRCDLRGMKIAGRRFMGTTFVDCKMAGISGTPVIEGDVDIERADLSVAGDGSQVRGLDAFRAAWGLP